jgi:succinyl-diaminopimelate desuccinylase
MVPMSGLVPQAGCAARTSFSLRCITNRVSATHRDDLASLLAALVGIPTENPPGEERAYAEFVVEWFEQRDIDAELVGDPFEDRPQAVARVGDGEPTLVLNGHLDVVPAGDAWTYDPYGGDIEDGRLYGRGSADMKAGIAVAMLAAADLQAEIESGTLDGSLVVHGAIGEETGDPGTKRLLERGWDGDYGIVLEPTDFHVATSAKGLAWYDLRATGESAHASQPDRATNAIDIARHLADAVDEYDADLRTHEDDLVGPAYATVTQFVAGAGTNRAVIPDEARVTVDRRILPNESVDDVDREIAALVEEVAAEYGVRVDWERDEMGTYEAASIPVDSPLAETVREHAAAVADAPTDPWGIRASTDVRNFVNDADIDAVTWGPGKLEQAHTVDEYIELADAEKGLEVVKRVARDLLSGGG